MSEAPKAHDVAAKMRALQFGVDPLVDGWESLVLDRLGEEHDEHANPLTPWGALRWARDHDLNVPGWVMDFFYERGGHISRLVGEPDRRIPLAEAVGRVLGFGAARRGATAPATAAALSSRDWRLAYEVELGLELVQRERRNRPLPMDAMINEVAKRNRVSATTVRRAREVYGAGATAQLRSLLQALDCHD